VNVLAVGTDSSARMWGASFRVRTSNEIERRAAARYEAQGSALAALKKSLLHQAFTGAL